MKKSTSRGNSGVNEASLGDVSQAQFWNFLKKGDDEGLQQALLRRVEDAETGEVTLTVRSSMTAELVNSPNAKKVLPLSYAIGQGMSERGLHVLLLAGAKIDAVDGTSERATALHAACWGEDANAVMTLLRFGANPLVHDAQGRTPLHVLASLNAISLFSLLLETATGADKCQHVISSSGEGGRPVEDHRLVKVTPEKLLGSKDKAGLTVLHTAVSDISSGSEGVIGELLSYLEGMMMTHADVVSKLVNMTTESGSTPLHLILSWRNCDENVMMRTVKRLLKLGACASAADNYGQTPVMVAVTTHSGATAANVVQVLLKNIREGEDSEARLKSVFMQCDDERGYTLIHHAIAANNEEVVRVFVAFLSEVDAAMDSRYVHQWLGELLTENDETVVHLLVEYDCGGIADILMESRALNRSDYEKYLTQHAKNLEKGAVHRQTRSHDSSEHCGNDSDEEGETDDEGGISGKQVSNRMAQFSVSSGGSRVQLARKARAKAASHRKKVAATPPSQQPEAPQSALPAWVKLGLLLVFVALGVGIGFVFRTTIVFLTN